MGKLDNKVAIITGSTRGIGKAIAAAFVREGARVVITSARKSSVDKALKEFPGENAYGHVCDVSDYDEVEKLVLSTVEKFGGLDIFINNAGISDTFYNITDSDPREWGRIIDINPVSYTHLTLPTN